MKILSYGKRCFALLLAAALLFCCLSPCSAAKRGDGKTVIRVFETSDIHGCLMDASGSDEDRIQYRLAYIARCVNDARASDAYDDVLLLDGGDVYQGTSSSDILYGASVRAAMDHMGYDALALGNHDFYWGLTEYGIDPDGTVPAYSLGEYAGDPDTPVVVGNLYDADTGEPVSFARGYTVVEKAGCRIAIIGYVPDYTENIKRVYIAPYVIDPSLERLAARVKKINAKEQPDVTIILAHEDPVGIAEAMDPAEVDLVAGGHSHVGQAGFADSGVAYIQPERFASGYGCADIVLDRTDGSVVIEAPSYQKIVGTELEDRLYDTAENAPYLDPVVMAISRTAWKIASEGMDEVLGYIDTPIEQMGLAAGDNGATTGGNWITGLMLEATKEQGAVAAFYNRGGIRADFVPGEQGTREVTVGDVYSINPYGNLWLLYDLTGEELARQLYNGLVNRSCGDQMTGLTFTYYQLGDGDDAVYRIESITLSDGREVDVHDRETVYRICISNYSSTVAGSVFEGKEPVYPETDAPVDNLALIGVLRRMRDSGDGYIPVDTGARGTRLPVCGLHGDVDPADWCHEAVDYVMENGLMIGVSEKTFAPGLTVTRATAVSVLYRLAGRPETEGAAAFGDVPDGAWYAAPVRWAEENGVVFGCVDGIFCPDDAVTREQLVTLLWRFDGSPDADEAALDGFADAALISDWARQAFAWAVCNGVIRGTAQNRLAPDAAAKRGEFAQILYGLSGNGTAQAAA